MIVVLSFYPDGSGGSAGPALKFFEESLPAQAAAYVAALTATGQDVRVFWIKDLDDQPVEVTYTGELPF